MNKQVLLFPRQGSHMLVWEPQYKHSKKFLNAPTTRSIFTHQTDV